MKTPLSKTIWVVVGTLSLLGYAFVRAANPEGLLAYYPLDGDGRDASGNGHDGAVQGATPTSNRFGEEGKALLFDGTNSFIRVADDPSLRLSGTDFTIAAWIFEAERDEHFNNCIVSKRGPAGPGRGDPAQTRGWILTVRGLMDTNTTGRLFFQVSGGEDPRAVSKRVLELNQWHHVVVVYHAKSGSMDMFVDGVLDSTTEGIPTPNPGIVRELHIGNDSQLAYDNAYVFHGKISDVRIYNRALTAGELKHIYGTGLFINRTQFTGQALVRMYGGLTPGQKVIIESSPDLIHWTAIETNIVRRPALSVTNFVHPAKPAEFFRVSVQD